MQNNQWNIIKDHLLTKFLKDNSISCQMFANVKLCMLDIWPWVDNKNKKLYNEKGSVILALGSFSGDMAS